jgi:hypothetical protein
MTPRFSSLRCAATLAIALGAFAGCGDNVETAPDAATVLPRQIVTLTETLPPGTVVEGTWQANPGDQIRLYLTADAAKLDWDIHAHNNGGTQDVAYAFGQDLVAYDFQPTADGPWYLLLRDNSDDTLTVDIGMELYAGATWQGFQ